MAVTGLQGKVAFVTGAGSAAGSGSAAARALGQAGATVALTSTTDRIHQRATALAADGIAAAGYVCDLTDRAAARALVAEIAARHGRIDILVNNAGIAGPTGRIEDLEVGVIEKCLSICLTSQFVSIGRAVPHLRQSRSAERRGGKARRARVGAQRLRARGSRRSASHDDR